jgi:hypothetical protein
MDGRHPRGFPGGHRSRLTGRLPLPHCPDLRSDSAAARRAHIWRIFAWAGHLLRTRALQAETGGFTEFVPLPFVHMAAPIYRKRQARPGPTFRAVVEPLGRRLEQRTTPYGRTHTEPAPAPA